MIAVILPLNQLKQQALKLVKLIAIKKFYVVYYSAIIAE